MTFHHYSDPAASGLHSWPFVYLHGAAEQHNDRIADDNAWVWQAPDCFLCSEPMPTAPGVYRGSLYGFPVIAVLAFTHWPNQMCGRVVIDDPKRDGYEHAFAISDWR